MNINFLVNCVLEKILETTVDKTGKKLIDLVTERALPGESYDTKAYRAVVNTFMSYCAYHDTVENKKEIILKISEDFVNQCIFGSKDYRAVIEEMLMRGELNCFYRSCSLEQRIDIFMKLLYENICRDDELTNMYTLKNSIEMFQAINGLKEMLIEINKKVSTGNEIIHIHEVDIGEKKIDLDVKSEYIAKWESRLFLRRRNEDKSLTLKNTFIMPLYKFHKHMARDCSDDLEFQLDKFVKSGKSLLLLGQPGIGQPSIVCYLADKNRGNPDFFVLRFRDWDVDEWGEVTCPGESVLLRAVKQKLNCNRADLRDKLLVLDAVRFHDILVLFPFNTKK